MRIVALGAAVVLALGVLVLVVAGRVLVGEDPLPARADAAVIMAGSIPDRVLEAADLFHAGVVPLVIVTRERLLRGAAQLRARGVRLPESDALTVNALRALGVPESAIVPLRRRDSSTVTEVRSIARFACRRRLRSLVAVTSRVHTRRAGLILRRALGPEVTVAVRASRYDSFSATRWWRVRRDAKFVLSEWQKLVHYWMRERAGVSRCGGLRKVARASGPRASQAAATAALISGASSPRACISRTMSQPPMNLPAT